MYCKEVDNKIFLCCEYVNNETIVLRDVRMFIKKEFKSENLEIFIKNYHLNSFFDNFTLFYLFKFFKYQSIEVRKNFSFDYLFNKNESNLLNLSHQVSEIFDKIFSVEKNIIKKTRKLSKMTQVFEEKLKIKSFLENEDTFCNKIL
jgi:hypothetical protein